MTMNDPGSGGAGGNPGGKSEDDNINDFSGGDDPDDKPVKRSTHLKAVTEAKNARERARIAEEKANRLEQEKLAAQGDKDGEIKTLRQQLADKEKSHKSLQQTVIKKALNAQVTAAASKAGCIDPSAVMRLIDLAELGDVDSETLEADQESVDSVISGLKKEKPYLFSKPGPKVNNRPPSGKIVEDSVEQEDLSKLTPTQLRERLRALDKENKK